MCRRPPPGSNEDADGGLERAAVRTQVKSEMKVDIGPAGKLERGARVVARMLELLEPPPEDDLVLGLDDLDLQLLSLVHDEYVNGRPAPNLISPTGVRDHDSG